MTKNTKSATGKKFYRIHLKDDVALKLDIVCAVKNQNPSTFIEALLEERFEKLNSEKLEETIIDIENI